MILNLKMAHTERAYVMHSNEPITLIKLVRLLMTRLTSTGRAH